jgi:hypothetical protein
LPLFWPQVLPNFTPAKHLLLALRGQAVEMLQSLNVFLLALRWQMAKCRIALQGTPLLIERLITMLVQPLAKVMPLLWRPVVVKSR